MGQRGAARAARRVCSQGKRFTAVRLDDARYLQALNQKLAEELAEYDKDGSLEELADVAEVLYAIVRHKGVSLEEFEAIRKKKREQRGGFDERLFLVSVEE